MKIFTNKLSIIVILSLLTHCAFAQSGTVFRDFNGNGTKDTNEPLVSGILVKAFNAAGTQCASTTSAGTTSPNYTLTGCSGQVRVEFTIPAVGNCVNSGIDFSSASGTTYGSSVQFVASTATNVNFAVHNPSDYNTGTTGVNVFIPCYINGDPLVAGGTANGAWFIGYPYTNSGATTTTPPSQKVNGAIIGPTWGVAYSKQAKKVFTSALVKRHVGLGSLGSGGIYMLTPTATSFTVNSFYNMDANGHRTRAATSAPAYGEGTSYSIAADNSTVTYLGSVDALIGKPAGLGVIGTNAQRGLTSDPNDPSFDPAAFDQVGKVGLGDIDISDDGKFLFVMNLYSRKVFRLELNDAYNPTSVVSVTSYDVPAKTCTNGEYRPWGLKFYRGKLYVGVVCSGENGGTLANVNASVYELNNPTATATFNSSALVTVPLDYARLDDWHPWTNDSEGVFGTGTGLARRYGTPLLSDIEFSDNGDMVLGFMDRSGHQWGDDNRRFLKTTTTSISISTAGDVLIAGLNCNSGSFILENDGSVTSANGTVLTGSSNIGEGPGGKEFFNDSSNSGDPHNETTTGALAVLKGQGEVFLTAFAQSTNSGDAGTMTLSTTNGSYMANSNYELYNRVDFNGVFAKANGLGDVELSGIEAPIEIGNRIWQDTDKDGIQDAGENGVDGVEIELYEGTSATGLPVQTVTSATLNGQKGSWFFTNLKANQDYVIKVKTALGTGTLATYSSFSLTGVGTTLIDNNTTSGTIALKTGNAGENNHSFDIGVITCTPPTAVTASSNSPVNQGSAINLTSTSTGGTSYSWSGPNGFTSTSQNPTIASATLVMAGTYTVMVSSSGTCTSTATTAVLVTPTCTPPTPTASGTTICSGSTATLTSSGCDATYPAKWYSNAALTTEVGSSAVFITPALTATTDYYVACVKDATCKSLGVKVTVNVNQKPNAGTDQTLACANPATNTLTTATTLVPVTAGGTFTQIGVTPAVATIAGNAVSGMTVAGTYQFQYSVAGCLDTVAVTVSPCSGCVKPNAGADAAAVCQPTSTAKLTAITSGGTWAAQTGNPSAATIDATGNISGLSAAGTYKFIYSVTGGGITCTDTAQVVVNAKPVIADGTATICAGTSVDLTTKITGYASLLSPVWTVATATGTAVSTPTAVSPSSTTTYVLVAQNALGCKDTASVVVTVNANPTNVTASSNSPVNEGASINLTSSSIGGTSYSWSGPNGFTSTSQNPTIASATLVMAGTYTVIVSSSGTCTSTATVVLIVTPTTIPPVDLALTKTVLSTDCKKQIGDNVVFKLLVRRQDLQTISVSGISVKDSLSTFLTFVSATASKGTYDNTTKLWSGITLAKGDSAILEITAKISAVGGFYGGLVCNEAWIQTMNGTDIDSQVGNKSETEDDFARACVSVPIKICQERNEIVIISAPAGYTSYQWYDDATGQPILGATLQNYSVTKAGKYSVRVNGNTCPNNSCCPIYVEDFCECTPNICVPFVVQKTKTRTK